MRKEPWKLTSEEEPVCLNAWIMQRLRKCEKSPVEWCYVTMDADGRVYAAPNEPSRCDMWGLWKGGKSNLLLGTLPEELRIYPWHEFLLKFGEVKPYAVLTHADGSQTVWDGPGEVGRRVPAPLSIKSVVVQEPPAPTGPSFEREVWFAAGERSALRLRVAIVEEGLPSPQEVAHWRMPTDEEIDEALGMSWSDQCPVDI